MKKIFLSIIVPSLLIFNSCKKFIDVNNDPNVPIDVNESLILSPAELDIAHVVASGFDFYLVNHWMQNVSLNQPIPNHGTYQLFNNELDGDWSNLYTTCINNLQQIIKKAEAAGNSSYAGIGKVLTAFSLGTGTDLWGDLPYSQAFQGASEFRPAYDKQEDIYKNIQSLLDDAITNLKAATGTVPGSDDLFYGGDLDKWIRLAYTLKARYYLHLTKAPGYSASTQADLALTALQNGMQSNDDDLAFVYPGSAGQENPWYGTFHPVSTLMLSEHLVEGFKTRNDPRLTTMVAPAQTTGLYTGLPIGTASSGYYQLESYSRPGAFYGAADATLYVVNYTEALFLKAEATLIKSGYTAAEPVYDEAIMAHMNKLNVNASDAAAYISSRTLTVSNALSLIIEEKSIANYLSVENFNDWRRTGYPVLIKVPNGLTTEIPRRFLYPEIERISNPQTIQSAKITDRVWWDQP